MNFMSKYSTFLLSALRIMAGLVYLEHGTSRIFGFPYFATLANLPFNSLSGGIAGTLELVLGTLIVIGFYSRPAAFLASGMMVVAYFISNVKMNFFPVINGGDLVVALCFVFLYLAAAGPGPIAINQK